MSFVALAIGGSAVAGLGGSVLSGLFGASASSKQASAIRYSADRGAEVVEKMNAQARADLKPFREMGVDAGKQLMRMLLGGGEEMNAVTMASPLFKFQSELGMRNINRDLAAKGLFGSGAGLETLARFNNQLVGEEADRLFGRLFNVTSLGENAAAKTASGNIATGQSIANIEQGAGQGIAGAIGNQYRAISSSIGSGVDAIRGGVNDFVGYQMYQPLLQRLAGSGGGGGSFMVNAPGGGISSFSLTGAR